MSNSAKSNYRKSRLELSNEIYALIKGRDLAKFHEILDKTYPKFRGRFFELSTDQMEKILPLVKEAYE